MRKIKITAGDVVATGVLNDNDTADAIWEALPISARGNTWGDAGFCRVAKNALHVRGFAAVFCVVSDVLGLCVHVLFARILLSG